METDDEIYAFVFENSDTTNLRKSITDRLFYSNSVYINGCYALNEADSEDQVKKCVSYLFKQFISEKIKRTNKSKILVKLNDFVESSLDFYVVLKEKNMTSVPMLLYDKYDIEILHKENNSITCQFFIIASFLLLNGYVLYMFTASSYGT